MVVAQREGWAVELPRRRRGRRETEALTGRPSPQPPRGACNCQGCRLGLSGRGRFGSPKRRAHNLPGLFSNLFRLDPLTSFIDADVHFAYAMSCASAARLSSSAFKSASSPQLRARRTALRANRTALTSAAMKTVSDSSAARLVHSRG